MVVEKMQATTSLELSILQLLSYSEEVCIGIDNKGKYFFPSSIYISYKILSSCKFIKRRFCK